MSFQQSLNRQRGVVIVVALFIVAIVATMSYVMMARMEKDTRRTMLLLRDTQAGLYAQGSVAWAIDQLRNNWDKKKTNQIVDVMPMTSPTLNQNGYEITSTIEDMQARYNVNNINTPQALADFKRLVRVVVPQLPEKQIEKIKIVIKPVSFMSELVTSGYLSSDLLNALRPYVTALPAQTSVNVQHVSAPVIMTLSATMTWDAAQKIAQIVKSSPPATLGVFLNIDMVKNHHITEDKLTVVSQYFLVETSVRIENQRAVLYTLLERKIVSQKAAVNIVWQSKGIW
jgi:general secretion pathway protein K